MDDIIREWSRRISAILNEAEAAVASAQDLDRLEACRVYYLGRKGVLAAFLKDLGNVPAQRRPEAGKMVNDAKNAIEQRLVSVKALLEGIQSAANLERETLDVTLPGWSRKYGHSHPVTQTAQAIVDIFVQMGFVVHEGPEIETDYYNFEALNIPKDHPARDMHDTLYVSEELLLRTHTSPIQIHVMQSQKPPMRIIAPGRVYRCDEVDASHAPMFHQIEGFLVDQDVTFSNLKHVFGHFAKVIFGEKAKLRFRPSFFPFTEPSAEVDVACSVCEGSGCRVCSSRGWLEILGAGMIHPKVFEAVGYDPETTTGFAFGMGVERIAMLRYGISDIRLFFENDGRFLNQF